MPNPSRQRTPTRLESTHVETKRETPVFRPRLRPPVAVLVALDDVGSSGEKFRLRKDRTTIGREETDVQIFHDPLMSRHHATITRKPSRGGFAWSIQDAGSQNGTFARVRRIVLKNDHEFILGSRRYRFCTAKADATKTDDDPGASATTMVWNAVSSETLQAARPRLTEIADGGNDKRSIFLDEGEMRLGRDPASNFELDDSFADWHHARLSVDFEKEIVLEDLKSVNGLWVRVDRLPLRENCDLMMGEQRFRFVLTETAK